MSLMDSFFLDPNEAQKLMGQQAQEMQLRAEEMNNPMSELISSLMSGGINKMMSSPSLLKLMDLLTGAMLADNALDPTIYMKDIMKAMYGTLMELMNMPHTEEMEYLATVRQAVDELIIERHATAITVMEELNNEPDRTENAGNSTPTENGDAGTSGDTSGN